MRTARTALQSTTVRPFVVELADPDGHLYTALEIELIDPWDEFYVPSDEGVEGFDIVWDPRGFTLLVVRIEEGPGGRGPIDIETVLGDADGSVFTALERDLVDAFDQATEHGVVRVLGFDISHDGARTTLSIVARR